VSFVEDDDRVTIEISFVKRLSKQDSVRHDCRNEKERRGQLEIEEEKGRFATNT